MPKCENASCTVGGNETCCHECQHAATCTDVWLCDDADIYRSCLGDYEVTA